MGPGRSTGGQRFLAGALDPLTVQPTPVGRWPNRPLSRRSRASVLSPTVTAVTLATDLRRSATAAAAALRQEGSFAIRCGIGPQWRCWTPMTTKFRASTVANLPNEPPCRRRIE